MKVRGTVVGTPIKPEKVLVKSENLTEGEKAKARANIGAARALVVTASADGKASHTVEEIWDAHKKGAAVSFVDVEGFSHMPILIAETVAVFERVVVTEVGVKQVVVAVENEDNTTVLHTEYMAEGVIDDTTESTEKTWSSTKVATEIEKSAGGSVYDGYKKAIETFCPKFNKLGRVVQVCPVGGYPCTAELREEFGDHAAIGSVTILGKNLYDRVTYPVNTKGYPSKTTGAFSTSETYKRTGFIPVEHLRGQTITLNYAPNASNPGMAFYKNIPDVKDADACKAAFCGGGTGANIVVPDNASYMCFCVAAGDADNMDIQIELGKYATEYEAYSERVIEISGYNNDFSQELRNGWNTIYANNEVQTVFVECREDVSELVRYLQYCI